MIRMYVTHLETYRYWKAKEESTLDDLLTDLRGVSMPTMQMSAGQAFHSLLENLSEGRDVVIERAEDEHGREWNFFIHADCELPAPVCRELKMEHVIETRYGPVTLVGKIDCIDPHGKVHDYKLSERWDAEKYLDSLQWRAYLVMFGADSFVYDVFVGKYGETAEGQGCVDISEHHPLEMCSYAGMEEDVMRAVDELAAIFVEYLPERVTVEVEEQCA